MQQHIVAKSGHKGPSYESIRPSGPSTPHVRTVRPYRGGLDLDVVYMMVYPSRQEGAVELVEEHYGPWKHHLSAVPPTFLPRVGKQHSPPPRLQPLRPPRIIHLHLYLLGVDVITRTVSMSKRLFCGNDCHCCFPK